MENLYWGSTNIWAIRFTWKSFWLHHKCIIDVSWKYQVENLVASVKAAVKKWRDKIISSEHRKMLFWSTPKIGTFRLDRICKTLWNARRSRSSTWSDGSGEEAIEGWMENTFWGCHVWNESRKFQSSGGNGFRISGNLFRYGKTLGHIDPASACTSENLARLWPSF